MRDAPPDPQEPTPPPDLLEAFREVGAAGRATWDAATDAGKALRSLVSADISLARSAMGRSLAFTGLAVAMGASGWLLLMTALIVALTLQFGWPWWAALVTCAVVSLLVAAYAARRAVVYFEFTRMQATRRQLARLGIGELAKFSPDAGDDESSLHAAQRLRERAKQEALKDTRGVDVTPP